MASAVSAGAILGPKLLASCSNTNGTTYPICYFSKSLQFLDYEQLGEATKDVGFKGIELSVRDEGHVLPENVKTDFKGHFTIFKEGWLMYSDCDNEQKQFQFDKGRYFVELDEEDKTTFYIYKNDEDIHS